MAKSKQGREREVPILKQIGNFFSDMHRRKKDNKTPECGIGNLCCHTDGAPRIIVVGDNNEVTRSFHKSTLEASDRCASPLLVDLRYELDAEIVSGLKPPILLIMGKVASDGVNLSVDEIGILLEKEGFAKRWEL